MSATEKTFDQARDAMVQARDDVAELFGLDPAEIDTMLADLLAFSICEHAQPGQERDVLEVFIAGMRRQMNEGAGAGGNDDLATVRPAGRA